jgi:hypothetical protein
MVVADELQRGSDRFDQVILLNGGHEATIRLRDSEGSRRIRQCEFGKKPVFIAGQVWIKHHGGSGRIAEFDYLPISAFGQYRAMPHFTRRAMPNCPAQV